MSLGPFAFVYFCVWTFVLRVFCLVVRSVALTRAFWFCSTELGKGEGASLSDRDWVSRLVSVQAFLRVFSSLD
jgi:hypothetical protein